MRRILVINNLISVTIHVCICILFLLPMALVGGTGPLWSDARIER